MKPPVQNLLIYGSILLFSYLIFAIIEGETNGLLPSVILWSTTGLIISFTRRYISRKKIGSRSFLSILSNDFYFHDYATISLLSFLYTIAQGICIGCSVNFLVEWFLLIPTDSSQLSSYYPLGISFGCILRYSAGIVISNL